MFSRRSFVAAGLLAPLVRPAAAEARYPAHSVTVVNPFAAGGQSDPIGRIVNAHFQNALGQPFLMENSRSLTIRSQTWRLSSLSPKHPRCSLQARKADFEPSMILCRRQGRNRVESAWLPPESVAFHTSSRKSSHRSSECNSRTSPTAAADRR